MLCALTQACTLGRKNEEMNLIHLPIIPFVLTCSNINRQGRSTPKMLSTVSGSEPTVFTLLVLQLTQFPSLGVSDSILFDGDHFETHR